MGAIDFGFGRIGFTPRGLPLAAPDVDVVEVDAEVVDAAGEGAEGDEAADDVDGPGEL